MSGGTFIGLLATALFFFMSIVIIETYKATPARLEHLECHLADVAQCEQKGGVLISEEGICLSKSAIINIGEDQ